LQLAQADGHCPEAVAHLLRIATGPLAPSPVRVAAEEKSGTHILSQLDHSSRTAPEVLHPGLHRTEPLCSLTNFHPQQHSFRMGFVDMAL